MIEKNRWLLNICGFTVLIVTMFCLWRLGHNTIFEPLNLILCIDVIAIVIVFVLAIIFVYFLSVLPRNNLDKIHGHLIRAIVNNDVLAVAKLITNNPRIINNRSSTDGYTPFMRACLMGKTQIVNLMLQNHANLSLLSPKRETPFYLAVFNLVANSRSKDASCISTLYYSGCDINITNDKGYAPLHLATMFGHSGLVKWLLSKGAYAISPDPYLLARFHGHHEIAKILKDARLLAIEN